MHHFLNLIFNFVKPHYISIILAYRYWCKFAIKLQQNCPPLMTAARKFGMTAKATREEAQLSLRGRAMLRVIEYFAKSLKTTQGHRK